jgi:hypothetical protein
MDYLNQRNAMKNDKKKPYEKPTIESERVFEHTALSCGSMFPGDSKDIGVGTSGDCHAHAVS